MHTIRVWLKASRLQSQSYIFLPVLVGQAFFVFQGSPLNWPVFFIMVLFGLFNQLYIIFGNDYADMETDCQNKTFNIFSGGSRVLADKDLMPAQLKTAAIIMALLCLFCGFFLTVFFHRLFAMPIVAIALGFLWLYSYKPAKLSYRGGGEFLQVLGIGFVLPFFGYYAQAGDISGLPWTLLLAMFPTQLACAMATSLPDEPSDRLSGKHTITVLLGEKTTKKLIIILNFISIVFFAFAGRFLIGRPAVYIILLLPFLAEIAQFFFMDSKPGSIRLTVFNFFSVLITLSLMGGLAIFLLC